MGNAELATANHIELLTAHCYPDRHREWRGNGVPSAVIYCGDNGLDCTPWTQRIRGRRPIKFQPGFENVWELPFSFRVDEYDRSLRDVDQRYGRDAAAGEDERVAPGTPELSAPP